MYGKLAYEFMSYAHKNKFNFDLGFTNQTREYNIFLRAKDIPKAEEYFNNNNATFRLEYFGRDKKFVTLFFK